MLVPVKMLAAVVPMAVTVSAAFVVPMVAAVVPGLESCQRPESNLVTPAPTVVLVMIPWMSLVFAFAPPNTKFLAPVPLSKTLAWMTMAPVPLLVTILLVALSSTTLVDQVSPAPV